MKTPVSPAPAWMAGRMPKDGPGANRLDMICRRRLRFARETAMPFGPCEHRIERGAGFPAVSQLPGRHRPLVFPLSDAGSVAEASRFGGTGSPDEPIASVQARLGGKPTSLKIADWLLLLHARRGLQAGARQAPQGSEGIGAPDRLFTSPYSGSGADIDPMAAIQLATVGLCPPPHQYRHSLRIRSETKSTDTSVV